MDIMKSPGPSAKGPGPDKSDALVLFGASGDLAYRQIFPALHGLEAFPEVRCNAPWVSAVLEPGNQLRPCFFHPLYSSNGSTSFESVLNSTAAIAFRRGLDVQADATCQRCVCSLSLPVWAEA